MQVRWCDFLKSYLDSKSKNTSYKEPLTRLLSFIYKNAFCVGITVLLGKAVVM